MIVVPLSPQRVAKWLGRDVTVASSTALTTTANTGTRVVRKRWVGGVDTADIAAMRAAMLEYRRGLGRPFSEYVREREARSAVRGRNRQPKGRKGDR